MSPREYPKHYRRETAERLVGALDSGYSVSVIGPPSVGKSNLLQYLDQYRQRGPDELDPWAEYAKHHMHDGPLIAVPVDPNALLPPLPMDRGTDAARAWPGFELLVHRMTLIDALKPRAVVRAGEAEYEEYYRQKRERFLNIHTELTDFDDALQGHLALRYFERMVEMALESFAEQDHPVRLVFVLDEFERMLDILPDYFFVALRSVRDRFKGSVMFVTFTRDNLLQLVDTQRRHVLEPFLELFNDNPLYLGPFSDNDAWNLVENLERRQEGRDDYGVGLLIRASGGFAGLLRAGFQHVKYLEQIPQQDPQRYGYAAKRLIAEENVQIECETLLRGLRQIEIDTLYGVVEEKTDLDGTTLKELVKKSLLRENPSGGAVRVTPPVLAAYIRTHSDRPTPRPRARPFSMPT